MIVECLNGKLMNGVVDVIMLNKCVMVMVLLG